MLAFRNDFRYRDDKINNNKIFIYLSVIQFTCPTGTTG